MKNAVRWIKLLDYSINSSLVISNIAIRKFDKAGIITFADSVDSTLTADNRSDQMNKILECFIISEQIFVISDYETLSSTILNNKTQEPDSAVY